MSLMPTAWAAPLLVREPIKNRSEGFAPGDSAGRLSSSLWRSRFLLASERCASGLQARVIGAMLALRET